MIIMSFCDVSIQLLPQLTNGGGVSEEERCRKLSSQLGVQVLFQSHPETSILLTNLDRFILTNSYSLTLF